MPLNEKHSELDSNSDCHSKGTSSLRTQFRVIASVPLRKHMAILNKHETSLTIVRLADSDSIPPISPVSKPLSLPTSRYTHELGTITGFNNKDKSRESLQDRAKTGIMTPTTAYPPIKAKYEPISVFDMSEDQFLNREIEQIPHTREQKQVPAINNETDPQDSRASSVSTIKSTTTPPIEQPVKVKDIVVIDLDDGDDDNGYDDTSERQDDEHKTESVLGKRKAGFLTDTSNLSKRPLEKRAPQASTGSRSNDIKKTTEITAGSQQCPLELDSDSEDENPTYQRQYINSLMDNAGSTIHQPILITTEHSESTDNLISQSISNENRNSGALTTQFAETILLNFYSSKPFQNSAETGNIQQQLQDYQRLQKERFQQHADGAGTRNNIDNENRVELRRTFNHEKADISSIQNSAREFHNDENPNSSLLKDSDGEPLLPFEILLDGTRSTDTEEKSLFATDVSSSSSQANLNTKKHDPHKSRDGLELSEDQLYVVDQVMNKRKSVFFTGSAGTGKSVLLRELIIRLKARRSRWVDSKDWDSLATGKVAVTASTGIAACNIGGCTLHSFAGVGLGQDPFPRLAAKVKNNRQTVHRWKSTDVLIVDEVSMIDAELLDKLEHLARHIREDTRPWGGIQVVLCGDFFQLPPVDKTGKVKFCFEAECWSKTIHATIQLRQIFRQKDHSFADMLNQMRVGRMTSAAITSFGNLSRAIQQDDGLRPTELFPLRRQVEDANISMLRKLTGESLFFEAQDSGIQKDKMEQQCIAPTKLAIKVNSQVMLLRNQSGGSGGLVNGSVGTVVAFVNEPAHNVRVGTNGEPLASLNTHGELLPKVRFVNDRGVAREMVVGREEWTLEMPDGEFLARRVQIPLCLAWALSIHKSQGQTLPKVRVDLGRVFEKGQAYVALSRATSLEGLQVLNFDPRKVMVHPKVVGFYEEVEQETKRNRAH